jgi:hypothetical protein
VNNTDITKIVCRSLQPYKAYTGKILFLFIANLHKPEKNIENYKKNIEKEKNKKREEEIINVPEQYKHTQKSEFT